MKTVEIIWLLVIVLFAILEIYNFFVRDFFDVIAGILTVVALLAMIGVYYLIRKEGDRNA